MALARIGALGGLREDLMKQSETKCIADRLHLAVFNGDKDTVRKLVDGTEDSEPYAIDTPHYCDGRTLLHSAVQSLPSSIIEFLVKNMGASVDARDKQGRTPLMHAAANGFVRNIVRLIALGADMHVVDNEGLGAISMAAQFGCVKTVVWLRQAGVQFGCARDGRTPAHLAAFFGRCTDVASTCMLQRLMVFGVNLDATTLNGFTAVHSAALGNQVHVLQRLFELGSSISARDRNGITPLMIASAYGNLKSVVQLIRMGASTSLVDNRGYSAIHFAAEKVCYRNPNQYIHSVLTPLSLTKGRVNVLNYIFTHIPLLSLPDERGRRRRPTLGDHMFSIATWVTTPPCKNVHVH
jgi:ankyrin repeat protein